MTDEPDVPIGAYRPDRIAPLEVPPPDPTLVAALRGVTGLSSAFSDELDGLGFRTAIPGSAFPPLRPADVAIGRAVTLRYLPTRRTEFGNGRLSHLTLFGVAAPGDVAVLVAPRGVDGSVLGGRAAAAALRAGIAACVVSGAVRDIDEIEATGLPLWALAHTPATGRGRLEAVEINGPVEIAGIQILPGDVIVADGSGVVAVPGEAFAEIARRVLGG